MSFEDINFYNSLPGQVPYLDVVFPGSFGSSLPPSPPNGFNHNPQCNNAYAYLAQLKSIYNLKLQRVKDIEQKLAEINRDINNLTQRMSHRAQQMQARQQTISSLDQHIYTLDQRLFSMESNLYSDGYLLADLRTQKVDLEWQKNDEQHRQISDAANMQNDEALRHDREFNKSDLSTALDQEIQKCHDIYQEIMDLISYIKKYCGEISDFDMPSPPPQRSFNNYPGFSPWG